MVCSEDQNNIKDDAIDNKDIKLDIVDDHGASSTFGKNANLEDS